MEKKKLTHAEEVEEFNAYRAALSAALVEAGLEPATFYEAYAAHWEGAEIPFVVEHFQESVNHPELVALHREKIRRKV